MIVNRHFKLWILVFCMISNALGAQNTRYIDPIFSDVKVSTVNYSDVFNDGYHKMDIYQPDGDTAKARPLLLYIHGGAFYAGDKATQDCIDFCTHFAKKGYVAVSVNYRLANALLFLLNNDVQLESVLKSIADVKSAIRFFGKDAKSTNTYKIDTNLVFIGGYSAGAVSALHTAWVDAVSELDSEVAGILKNSIKTLDGDAGNVGYACNIKAVYSLAGALYKTSYASQGDQPVWMGHAVDDGTVNYNCAPALNNPMVLTLCGTGKITPRLDTVGVEYDTMVLQTGGHGWPGLANTGKDFVNAVAEIADFFYPMLTAKPANGIKNPSKRNQLRIYPNPSAVGAITVSASTATISSVSVYDMSGRLILVKTADAPNQTSVVVSVDNLPSSLYRVVVAFSAGETISDNLLIQNK